MSIEKGDFMSKILNRPEWAQTFKDARKRAGLSQDALGEKIGVKANTIRKYEIGSRFPSPTNLAKICAVLNLSPSELGSSDARPGETAPDFRAMDRTFCELTKYVPYPYEILEHLPGYDEDRIDVIYKGFLDTYSNFYTKTQLIGDITKIKLELDEKYKNEFKKRIDNLYEKKFPPPEKEVEIEKEAEEILGEGTPSDDPGNKG